MFRVSVLLLAPEPELARPLLRAFAGRVERLLLLQPPGAPRAPSILEGVPCVSRREAVPGSSAALAWVLDEARAPLLLKLAPGYALSPLPHALNRLAEARELWGAPFAFSSFTELGKRGPLLHPLSDPLPGSLQEGFPTGPWELWSVEAARRARPRSGPLAGLTHHAWYDLRLRASHRVLPIRVPEPLVEVRPLQGREGEEVFDYLTAPEAAQREAEAVVTEHLRRLNALVQPPFRPFESRVRFPVEASVVIPVRNRLRTIADAVRSALSQDTAFSYNVVVVDNHSTDGTWERLQALAGENPRLVAFRPRRRDLGIGGCWNAAVSHPAVGRYVVQLDSDDLYAHPRALQLLVSALKEQRAGMAVGSYTTVDFSLRPLPPGLVDHREWSDENGPNNALRVAGFGAPRAFATELLRRYPFPNTSYGEDYAVGLRLSRRWRVARVWEPIYLARRWEDNSDASLSPERAARYQHDKDYLRTMEILARRHAARRTAQRAQDGGS